MVPSPEPLATDVSATDHTNAVCDDISRPDFLAKNRESERVNDAAIAAISDQALTRHQNHRKR